jgi:NSS family neurotransmitter:Na+ symporter
MAKEETFSRWGLILAGLGLAVGTGNMWRFPRMAAQNGGAAFLIPWIIFLFLWSFPLMIAELSMGRGSRRGVIGAFTTLVGPRYAWMGGFIATTTIMILFYYSVVTGWTLKYFFAALLGDLGGGGTPGAYWDAYLGTVWEPVLFHVLAALIAGYVIQRGVTEGIERVNRFLVPMLFLLLAVAAVRAVTLPGAVRGVEFLFNPNLSQLASYRVWLEAATQSAWSTGAGWGLLLTYGAYMSRQDDIVLNTATIGFGNNSASLLAGLAVVPTAFAVLSSEEAMSAMRAGNVGLTFIWIPQLFAQIPSGRIFLTLFFLALFSAALSSLMAMYELGSRLLMDGGMSRRRAVAVVTGATIVLGLPSAVSMAVFENQDFVWGLALMISGLFVAYAAITYGVDRFRADFINQPGVFIAAGPVFGWMLQYLVPSLFVAMFGWWMYQVVTIFDPDGWWNPVRTFSIGTCVVQWAVAMLLLRAFNRRLAESSVRSVVEAEA